MKKKYLNVFVFCYVAFLSIFTIEITTQKIHTMKQEKEQEKMIIEYGDDGADEFQMNLVETPALASKAHIIESDVMTREYVYELSNLDYETLLRVVEAEAGCEDENGKLLVANVVLNRVNSKKFPSSVYDVVYQSNGGKVQFSTAYNGRINSVKVSNETKEAVERALYGEDISKGALYFISSAAVSPEKSSWFYTKLNHVFDYGRHSFFK